MYTYKNENIAVIGTRYGRWFFLWDTIVTIVFNLSLNRNF